MIAAIVHDESFTRSVPTVGNSSGAFRVRDQNGADWVAKSLDNGQSKRSTVTDALIGALAPLIDAPTCSTSILEYPQGLPAHELAQGVVVAPGYLHGDAGHWTVDDPKARVAEPRTLPQLQGVLPQALEHCEGYAEALRNVTTDGITEALSTIPAEWPVSLNELAHLAWFLAERREPVASRLEQAWN